MYLVGLLDTDACPETNDHGHVAEPLLCEAGEVGYVNEAETFEGRTFGEPFPPVPIEALSNFGSNSVIPAVENSRNACFPAAQERPQRESNPR